MLNRPAVVALIGVKIQAHLHLEDADEVRAYSYLCSVSRRFSRGIETLTIQLSKKNFVKVADHVNHLLRRAVNLEHLTLDVEHVSKGSQLRAFRRVNLAQLSFLTIAPTSYSVLLDFIQRHASLRDIRFSGSHSGVPAPSCTTTSLHLDCLTGPSDYVVELLSRCSIIAPEVKLKGKVTYMTLGKFQRMRGRLYNVYKLTIELHAAEVSILCGVSACFPRLRCLKIIQTVSALFGHGI